VLIINNLHAIAENDVRRIEICETIRKDAVAFFGELRQRDHVARGREKSEKFHFYGAERGKLIIKDIRSVINKLNLRQKWISDAETFRR
jgi:hypothetical protein